MTAGRLKLGAEGMRKWRDVLHIGSICTFVVRAKGKFWERKCTEHTRTLLETNKSQSISVERPSRPTLWQIKFVHNSFLLQVSSLTSSSYLDNLEVFLLNGRYYVWGGGTSSPESCDTTLIRDTDFFNKYSEKLAKLN